MFSDNH